MPFTVFATKTQRHTENPWCLRGFVANYFPLFKVIKVVIILEKVKKYCNIQNFSCGNLIYYDMHKF